MGIPDLLLTKATKCPQIPCDANGKANPDGQYSKVDVNWFKNSDELVFKLIGASAVFANFLTTSNHPRRTYLAVILPAIIATAYIREYRLRQLRGPLGILRWLFTVWVQPIWKGRVGDQRDQEAYWFNDQLPVRVLRLESDPDSSADELDKVIVTPTAAKAYATFEKKFIALIQAQKLFGDDVQYQKHLVGLTLGVCIFPLLCLCVLTCIFLVFSISSRC